MAGWRIRVEHDADRGRGQAVKYMIMTFGDETAWDTLGLGSAQATWSEEEVAEHFRAMAAFYADLAASGEMVTGFGLADPSHTVTWRCATAGRWHRTDRTRRPRKCLPASASSTSPHMTGRSSWRLSSLRLSRRGWSCAR